jgi:hypothetical protein
LGITTSRRRTSPREIGPLAQIGDRIRPVLSRLSATDCGMGTE